MKKRWPILLYALGLVLAAALFGLRSGERGVRSYQGKSVREWALQYYRGPEPARNAARAAFEAMGTNALPELIRLVKTDDPFWRKAVWNPKSRLAKPLQRFLIQQVKEPVAFLTREAAAHSIALYGPQAQPAIPQLVAVLGVRGSRLCIEAADALGRIGKPTVPALSVALQDRDSFVRCWAASALAQVGPGAEQTIPLLVAQLGNIEVTSMAACALANIGAPAIPALTNCFSEDSPQVLEKAAFALGEMGPKGTPALPALRELERASNAPPTVRSAAKEAHRKILSEMVTADNGR